MQVNDFIVLLAVSVQVNSNAGVNVTSNTTPSELSARCCGWTKLAYYFCFTAGIVCNFCSAVVNYKAAVHHDCYCQALLSGCIL